jgi:hypothetical protein
MCFKPGRLNALKRMALAIPVSQLAIVAKTVSNVFKHRSILSECPAPASLPTTAQAFCLSRRNSMLTFLIIHLPYRS